MSSPFGKREITEPKSEDKSSPPSVHGNSSPLADPLPPYLFTEPYPKGELNDNDNDEDEDDFEYDDEDDFEEEDESHKEEPQVYVLLWICC